MARDPLLVYQQQQAISVAIEAHLDEPLLVARCLPLAPKFVARAREVGYLSRCQRSLDRLAVHPCLHKHKIRCVADSDGGNQAALVELQGRP